MKTLIPESILEIIAQLHNEKSMTTPKLCDILAEHQVGESDLKQYATLDHPIHESYGRNTIYLGDNFGIYLMSWAQGDFTAIHSHGHSEWGAVCFLGDADHRVYSVDGNEIHLQESEILKKGRIEPVCGDLVHAMGNLSHQPFITLHIYGSNSYQGTVTEDSQVYEIEKNRIRTTFGPAFIDIKDELCKENNGTLITDQITKEDYYKIIDQYYKRNKIEVLETT